jgi:hypothetical protein
MSIVDSSVADTAASLGALVTSGGSANTKGAWDEAIASTSEETYWLQLEILDNATDRNVMINVGVGGAGSEVTVIADIPLFLNLQGSRPVTLPPMPITIAAGSRVAVQVQATIASTPVRYALYLSNDSDFGTSTSNVMIGGDVAGSIGTDIDPGLVDHTKGSYTELVASTSIDINYLVVLMGNSNNGGQTTQKFLVDIATGAAASEVVNISDVIFTSSNTEVNSTAVGFFHTISSGTRVSARGQGDIVSSAAVGDRIFDVAILGFNLVPPSGGGGGIAQIVGQGGIVG